jgi:hypothetical protein
MKTIFINWRWKSASSTCEEQGKSAPSTHKELKIDRKRVVYLSNYRIDKTNMDDIVQINEMISQKKGNENLILLHDGNGIKSENITYHEGVITESFREGNHPVYLLPLGFISLDPSLENLDAAFDELKKMSISRLRTRFDYVWNLQINQLLKIWLPLAIDLQGLFELKDNERLAEKSYNALREDIDFYDKAMIDKLISAFKTYKVTIRSFQPAEMVDQIKKQDFASFIKTIELSKFLLHQQLEALSKKVQTNKLVD